MTLHNNTAQLEPEVITPPHTVKPTPTLEQPKTLMKTVYTIERKAYSFYLKIIDLYTDGTWIQTGVTYDEPLPHLFVHLEKLLMKGVRL